MTHQRKYNGETLYRDFPFEMSDTMEGSRTLSIAFSSEEPVERFFGTEILEHTSEAVDLERLNNGAALLVNHDPDDQVGVVESAQIDSDRIGRAIVRFGNSERAEEIFLDVKDGIRRLVSVGYRIHEEQAEKETVTAIRWEPLELSIVAIPADYKKAGVGRSCETNPKPKKNMPQTIEVKETVAPQINPEQIRSEELSRVREIMAEGDAHKMPELARNSINQGHSLEQFRSELLGKIKERSVKPPSAEIGLSPKEVKQFSFMRAVNALANPSDRRAQEAAAFEFEASAAACKTSKKESRGIRIPEDVLAQGKVPVQRAVNVNLGGSAGQTVSTVLKMENFIDMLRNNTIVYPLTDQINGLVGNIAIPRLVSGNAAYWVAEGSAGTPTDVVFDQVPLSPKTLTARTAFTRRSLLQSELSLEGKLRQELASAMGLEIDRTCINGSGVGEQPTGILNTVGIGSVGVAANGSAIVRDDLVDLLSSLSTVNADVGNLFYITNAAVRGALMKTLDGPNTAGKYLWEEKLLGHTPLVTNQVPSNLTKGTGTGLSALIFGKINALTVGLWGGLDLIVDQYTLSHTGSVSISIFQDMDIAVTNPKFFAAKVDAIA